MIGNVKILEPGFFSTIQDRGRLGYAQFGVPRSGAMDLYSFDLANLLVGNNKNEAVIEWVLKPPKLKFSKSAIISLTGACVDVFVDNVPVKLNERIFVPEGAILSLGICKNKMYGYVGIKNGFLTRSILASRSFYKGITDQYRLHKGDLLNYNTGHDFNKGFSKVKVMNPPDANDHILVLPGPEYELLSEREKTVLMKSNFRISNLRNRMAIQLENELKNHLPSILTSPVLPGTVQLTPSGKLIVLMRDCQTTGGYPRILQLTQNAINRISQKRTGENIRFVLSNFC